MQRAAVSSSDRLTLIAIAFIAYAGMNISHEIIGHCFTAALLGTGCALLSSSYIPLVSQPPPWKYNIILIAGSASNWMMGLISLGLLRTLRANPTLRYFLWLSMCVNLFLPSGYMAAAPIISYGDSYFLILGLPGQLFWSIALVLAGGALCWFCFRLCGAELRRLIGFGGSAARSLAWQLVVPAYLAGGIITVTSGLFSPLEFKWTQLQAAGGTFGLTIWLLLLPLSIPQAPEAAEGSFLIPRSLPWIVSGVLCALVFIGLLGPGIPM